MGTLNLLPADAPYWQRWLITSGFIISSLFAILSKKPAFNKLKITTVLAFIFFFFVIYIIVGLNTLALSLSIAIFVVLTGLGPKTAILTFIIVIAFAYSLSLPETTSSIENNNQTLKFIVIDIFEISDIDPIIGTKIGLIAICFTITFTFTLAYSGNKPYPLTFSISGAIAVSLAAAGYIWAFEFITLIYALLFALELLYKKAKTNKKLSIYWLFYTLTPLTSGLFLLKWIESPDTSIIFVFYLILPMINTPIDWISLGITRALLQSISLNRHRFGKSLTWSLLDLVLALLTLFLISSITTGVISLANLTAIQPIIDLNALFTSLESTKNWRDNLWIYFMLLSTLIPTATHFALVGGALTLSVSRKTRYEILSDMETNDLNAKRAWLYVSIMPAFGFVLAPTLLLYSLYWLLHTHGAWLGQNLLSYAIWLATLIDPTLGQISAQGTT